MTWAISAVDQFVEHGGCQAKVAGCCLDRQQQEAAVVADRGGDAVVQDALDGDDVHVGADRGPTAEEAVGPLKFLLDPATASSSLIARMWRSEVCTRLTTTL
jgi:hypothetical protein